MQNEQNKPVFLTTAEVAERFKCSIRTLEGWRDRGIGPNYHKIGGRVRYHVEDLERYQRSVRAYT